MNKKMEKKRREENIFIKCGLIFVLNKYIFPFKGIFERLQNILMPENHSFLSLAKLKLTKVIDKNEATEIRGVKLYQILVPYRNVQKKIHQNPI